MQLLSTSETSIQHTGVAGTAPNELKEAFSTLNFTCKHSEIERFWAEFNKLPQTTKQFISSFANQTHSHFLGIRKATIAQCLYQLSLTPAGRHFITKLFDTVPSGSSGHSWERLLLSQLSDGIATAYPHNKMLSPSTLNNF